VKVANAKGYHFSYADLLAATEAAKATDAAPARALIAKKTTYYGSNDDNSVFGNDLDGRLFGKGGDDFVQGGAGNDLLKGGKGNDGLWLYEGHDRAIGGTGNDIFVFRDEIGAFSVDKVKDFRPGQDIMQLGFSNAGILTSGELLASEFHVGKQAADADDRVIYRKAKGALYLDVDGVGGEAQVQFAKVTKGLALDHSDFLVQGLG
jgi:Ca2+-binding RTX toxin-like protein